jgi:mRNA-degrading endonuclease YafQ of YafQ-DinJ toxin-antitoxin module
VTWRLDVTPAFLRALKRYDRAHPDLRPVVHRVLTDLEQDPDQPSLRLHPLRGELAGRHAVRVTYSDRIVLILQRHAGALVLLDIGTHDDAYR